ncbi:MAG: hypothetical protein Q8P80_00815 [Candidatus Levybacteria bacterium]|nr:hypothetical protein [Candidatus Levybacteria bacterium]
MTSNDVKDFIGEFLKNKVVKGEFSYDRAQDISIFLQTTLKDDLPPDVVNKIIPTLDDNFKELNGVVMQLIVKIS